MKTESSETNKLISMKKILNKARLASKFTKDTKQVAKQHDLRN